MFVIVNHGRGIRAVVAALYVAAGIATMTPTPAQITSEATKIEREDHK
jgi:transcription initiation factor TFIIIB Brf1 subunit/transcription initiation factor TFIIB